MKRRIKKLIEVFIRVPYIQKETKLRILFDAKGMRQSSRLWYLKIFFSSLNKNQNKMVVAKCLYNSFENGFEKLSL